jgi:hypothetical protein
MGELGSVRLVVPGSDVVVDVPVNDDASREPDGSASSPERAPTTPTARQRSSVGAVRRDDRFRTRPQVVLVSVSSRTQEADMAAKKAAPKKATPKKAAPKKATPKKAAPKKAAPKKAAPKKATPKKATPKKAAPKKATPKKAAPKKAAPKKAAPKKAAPKKAASKKAAPKSAPSDAAKGRALCKLGDRHHRGQGVPEDFVKARALYREAAELGDESAMENLVFFYSKGPLARWTKTLEPSEPIAVDVAEALRWARELAARGADNALTIAALEKRLRELPSETPPTPPTSRASATDTQRRAVAEAARAHLPAHAAALDGALAPSFRLVPDPNGSSRLGGLPDLPADVAWPRGAKAPLSFVAQVDLATLPPSALPEAGLLSFFYDLAEMPWDHTPGTPAPIAVIHTPPGATLVPRDRPADLVAPHQYAHVELRPIRVRAEVELTLPWPRTKEYRTLGLPDAAYEPYLDHVYAGLSKAWSNGHGAQHRMFGHAGAIQGDMTRRLAYAAAGKPVDGPSDPAVEAAAAELRLLLQIDTDEALLAHWGDGRLFYWIRESDLAAGRFSEATFEFQG